MPLRFEPFDPADDGAPLTNANKVDIANIIRTWSLLEIFLEQLICALAQAPLHLGQALTEDLGPDHRIKALKRLCRMWQVVLASDHPAHALLSSIQLLATWVKANKDARNRLVHWQWRKNDGEHLVCFKYSLKPPAEKDDASPFLRVRAADLVEFERDVTLKNDFIMRAVKELDQLPAWRETLAPR